MIAADGDPSVVGVLFWGAEFTYNLGVRGFFALVIGKVLIFYDE